MSFEAWGSQSIPVVRFRVCGHVASRDEVDRVQAVRDGVCVCPVCFSESFHEEEEACSRDYIPSTRLTWEPAVCTTSELLTTRTPGRGSDSASAPVCVLLLLLTTLPMGNCVACSLSFEAETAHVPLFEWDTI